MEVLRRTTKTAQPAEVMLHLIERACTASGWNLGTFVEKNLKKETFDRLTSTQIMGQEQHLFGASTLIFWEYRL
jgi:hypothetical protein